MLMESTIHPSMVWHVDHEQSPVSSFLSESVTKYEVDQKEIAYLD